MLELLASLAILPMNESGQNSIQNLVEALARVLRQETQHKISILLQQGVLPSVPPISVGVGEMLRAIQLNDHARFRA
jgi:hypothetical protein